MSSEVAISVRGVSKAYTITESEDRPRTLVEALLRRARHPLRRTPRTTFWALRDLSFDIAPGEVVGVVGRNGAGKSTLLKILSRITSPTAGEIDLYGRVGSLLEVGTGFHPELTGTENIFLNGAILGMTKAEIRRQFDAIVDFAGVAKFLETPVKRYSSGMYVRLAFAVAAHLNPEILIVDEVLAVGDASFQQKCLGKMGEVASQGRTVLFVSHNMSTINQLCRRSIFLRQGAVAAFDFTREITRMYFESGVGSSTQWRRTKPLPEADGIYLQSITVRHRGKVAPPELTTDDAFTVEVAVHATRAYANAQINVRFTNQEGVAVLTTANADCFSGFEPITEGEHRFSFEMPAHLLASGTYYLLVAAHIPEQVLFDLVDGEVRISLDEVGPLASVMRDQRLGVVNPRLPWRHEVARPAEEPEPAGVGAAA